MFTVQDDWIEYETAELERAQLRSVTARRVAVRGGAACAQRMPVVSMRPAVQLQRAAARSMTPVRAARLRLTRRGRVVLVVMPALLALSGALLAAAPGVAEAAPNAAVPTSAVTISAGPTSISRTVVVASGESLWAVAERIAPHSDPRTTVAELELLNGLHGARVAAGAVLRLPEG